MEKLIQTTQSEGVFTYSGFLMLGLKIFSISHRVKYSDRIRAIGLFNPRLLGLLKKVTVILII